MIYVAWTNIYFYQRNIQENQVKLNIFFVEKYFLKRIPTDMMLITYINSNNKRYTLYPSDFEILILNFYSQNFFSLLQSFDYQKSAFL